MALRMPVLPILPPAVTPLLSAVWRRIPLTPAARLAIGFHLTGRLCRSPVDSPLVCRPPAAQARAMQLARTIHPARRTVPAQQQAQWLATAGAVGSRLDILSRETEFCPERPVGLLVDLQA